VLTAASWNVTGTKFSEFTCRKSLLARAGLRAPPQIRSPAAIGLEPLKQLQGLKAMLELASRGGGVEPRPFDI
jgi:hypothetical protein